MRNNRGLGQYGLGNIDLYARPQVKMPDGSIATVRSMSFNDGLKEVVIPTVSDDGRIMSDNEAIDNYYKTGKYLGKFDTVDEATKYANRLHNEQDLYYNGKKANFVNRLLGIWGKKMILEGGISKNYTQNWDKNGNIYYTDENGQVVDFKVNPFVKLAN